MFGMATARSMLNKVSEQRRSIRLKACCLKEGCMMRFPLHVCWRPSWPLFLLSIEALSGRDTTTQDLLVHPWAESKDKKLKT